MPDKSRFPNKRKPDKQVFKSKEVYHYVQDIF